MSFSLRFYHCVEKEKNVLCNLFVVANFVIFEVHCITIYKQVRSFVVVIHNKHGRLLFKHEF